MQGDTKRYSLPANFLYFFINFLIPSKKGLFLKEILFRYRDDESIGSSPKIVGNKKGLLVLPPPQRYFRHLSSQGQAFGFKGKYSPLSKFYFKILDLIDSSK